MNPPTASSLQSTLDRLRRAVAHEPSKAGHRIDLARCLLSLGRRGEAIAALNTARTVAGDEARAWAVIGTLWSNAGEQRAALEAYDRALTLAPSDPQILFNRATVRRYVGDLEGAEKDYDDAIEGRPSDFEAYLNRSDLRAQTSERNHIAQLRSLASRPRQDWGSEVQLRFALAKEYEDLGEFAKSFEQLQHGAKLRRQHMQYDLERDLATVDWIIDAYPASAPVPKSASAPPGDDDPIFIVGLPRSGTTLVERILGCHSTLSSAGELDEFALVLMHAAQQRAGRQHLERHELVAISATLDFSALGRTYLAQVRSRHGVRGRFIDKMPLNYLYCGLIRRALPQARIVHLTRHPMAVCYAMYKTLFKNGYPFSYDLDEISEYYLAYHKLMQHWRGLLGEQLYEVAYESIVADQNGSTRGILNYCNLRWEDACLQFHTSALPSTTASASQVRRPIYSSSVSQWRVYEEQLGGLRARLSAGGIAVD